jgi:signal transduction histidine kinase
MTRWIAGLWAWLLMAGMALAMTVGTSDQSINLLPALRYLEDPGGQLQLQDVQRPARQAQFQPWLGHGTALNFGLTESSYWIHFQLKRSRTSPDQWYLEVPNSLLGQLTLYTPNGTAVPTGADRPLRERPSFNRHFVFPIELTEQAQDFYLQVHSSNALNVPLQLWQPYAYQQHLHWQLLLQFVYFGCILTLLLYNTMLSGLLKDARFLIYAMYSLAMGLGMFSGNGFGGLYLWPDQHPFDAIAQSAFLCLSIIFATEFARHLLATPSSMPRLDLSLKGCTLLALLVLASLLLHLWHPMPLALVIQAFMVISLLMGVLILYISVKQAIAHRGSARYFAIGWGMIWVGAAIAAIHAIGAIPSNGFTAYALQISTAGEMFFLAISLASKVREERVKLEWARQQTHQAQTALVEVLRTSEQLLEQTVQQRTVQLEQSLMREREVLQQYVRFGSMISHEVRNPIHIIQSQISLWRKEKSVGMDHTDKRLNTMSGALRRLTDLFEKWLQSDRLKSPHLQLGLLTLDITAWLQTWLPAYQAQLPDHRLVWLPAREAYAVSMDPALLEMAVTNLLENAAKYSPVASTITISVPPSQSARVGICIDDEGIGIPPELQGQVFEDFFRAQIETSKPGIGLGLAIVQRIVQLHGGDVEVRPGVTGLGSSFCIWLPRVA